MVAVAVVEAAEEGEVVVVAIGVVEEGLETTEVVAEATGVAEADSVVETGEDEVAVVVQ